MSTDYRVWIAGILTVTSYSLLYKHNRFFELVEHLYIGLGAGYGIVMAWSNAKNSGLDPLLEGKWTALFGIVLGLMLFLRFSKSTKHMATYPAAFLVGIGSAVVLRTSIQADLLLQANATMLPFVSVQNVIIVIGSLAGLFFLSFTVGTKTAGKSGQVFSFIRTVGRLVLMITFGASIGSAVQGRISLVIGRAQFIINEWLPFLR